MNPGLRAERRGAGLWIVFERPEVRNALPLAGYERIVEVCADVAKDTSVRAVVVAGGADAFCSGTEIGTFRAFAGPDDAIAYERLVERALRAIEDLAVPSVAAIRGACTGGGMAIAAACDLRVADPAARFGFPVARTLGNCLSVANCARLRAQIGPAPLKEMLFLARLLDAHRAYELGFVSEVAGDVEARAAEMVATIASLAPLTIRAGKEAMRRIARDGTTADDADLIASCYGSADFREGVDAFLAKRAPRWSGT